MCAVCAGGQRSSLHPGPGDSRLRGGGDAGGLSGHADAGVEAPDAECEQQSLHIASVTGVTDASSATS
jgi:hypothetical protein